MDRDDQPENGAIMANRSYLLAVDDRSLPWSEDPEREIIAEGINEMPVFWASLFTAEDRQVDSYEGEGGPILIPNACVPSAVAKERLAALREPIGRLLDGRSRKVWTKWVKHLMASEAAYFKTDAAEVRDLDPDGYEAYWNMLLRLFAEPNPENLKAAVEANELSFDEGSVSWDDDEETICKLAGSEHIREVPWLD